MIGSKKSIVIWTPVIYDQWKLTIAATEMANRRNPDSLLIRDEDKWSNK